MSDAIGACTAKSVSLMNGDIAVDLETNIAMPWPTYPAGGPQSVAYLLSVAASGGPPTSAVGLRGSAPAGRR